ncbi:MAG: hypothetical protein HYZ13_01310 [Acidobacteria bacterium]|nr:hypothetical protein [Acidobacteriota bacterium]
MSVEFAVWHPDRLLGPGEAKARFHSLQAGQVPDLVADGEIENLMMEVSTRFGDLHPGVSDEADDASPWNVPLRWSQSFAFFSVRHDRCVEVMPWVAEAAWRRGLVVYHPVFDDCLLPGGPTPPSPKLMEYFAVTNRRAARYGRVGRVALWICIACIVWFMFR